MRRSLSKVLPHLGLFFAITMLVLGLTGCWKKSGPAVVLEKEHIAAREPTPTPAAEQSPSASSPTPTPGEEVEYSSKPLAEDEILVGVYVMKKNARGTGRDPRALDDEQWLVSVQMASDLRRFDVHTSKSRWEKIKVGDRIQVSYRQGKYTGTVWSAVIEE